jgi:hypothetical protein
LHGALEGFEVTKFLTFLNWHGNNFSDAGGSGDGDISGT